MTQRTGGQGRGLGGMSHRAAAWLAWLLWALCATLAVLAVLLDFHNPQVRSHLKFVVLAGMPLLVYPTIGAFVVSRRPRNAVGWILCGMGLVFEVVAFSRAYAANVLSADPGSPTGRMIDHWVTGFTIGPSVVLGLVLLGLFFPDGKLPHRGWWAVVWTAVCGAVLVNFWWVTWPVGALGAGLVGAVEMLVRLGGASLLVSCVVSLISVLVRLQRAEARERQQLKWFAYGAAVFLSAFYCMIFALWVAWAMYVVIVIGLLAIPVAVGIAMLRYRLYDIDVVINRTLVYGSLTLMLALVYFGGVTATQAVFTALTRQEEQPQLAIVVSTLVIAALFSPLRRRIQSFIDRRFYRRKYDAAKTLESFSAKLRD